MAHSNLKHHQLNLKRICFIKLVFTFLTVSIYAQCTQKKKLGVVLSGGGAKGMAHIGVLKAIDSLNLKVSFIGGTSMGSIIGSLYACGYSANEIEYRLKRMNWNELFNDEIPLNRINIEEKPDYGRFLLEIPIVKRKIAMPSGVIRGPNLYNELVKLTFPMIDRKSYDSLIIPLRVNAVDLQTGENVVFKNGFLPSAMRASMSIPSVFYPVELDSGYFVDGGVIRNTLIPEIKEMGSDYTIVSFTGNKLSTKQELNSMTKILGQVFFISGSRDIYQHEREADLFIQPKLSSRDASSFKRSEDIINAGIEACQQKFSEIEKISSDSCFERNTTRNPFHKDEEILNERFYIDEIIYQNLTDENQNYFESNTEIKAGQITTLKKFLKGIKNGYSTLRYDYIYYELKFNGYTNEGIKKISVKFKVNDAAKTKVRIGLHYDSDLGSGFMLNAINRDFLIKRSRLVLELDVAQNPRAKLTYMFYLDKKYRFQLGMLHQIERDEFDTFNSWLKTETYKLTNPKGYIFLQSKLSRNCAWNIGYEAEFMNFRPFLASDVIWKTLKSVNIRNQSMLSYFQFNTLNRPILPRKGIRFQAQYRYIFDSHLDLKLNEGTLINEEIKTVYSQRYKNYNKVVSSIETYIPLAKKLSYCLNADFSMIFCDDPNDFDLFYLGSVEKNKSRIVPQLGYRSSEIPVRNFFTLNSGIQYNVYKDLFLKVSCAGSIYNNTSYYKLFRNTDESGQKTSGFGFTASYLIPKFGPLSFTIHKSFDRAQVFAYLTFGYKFQLY